MLEPTSPSMLVPDRACSTQDAAAMARWGDEKTVHFISLYRQQECLWNTKSPLYKNRYAREAAYKSILQSFKDPLLDIKNVKTKIKNLRSVYHTELKKVKYTSRRGDGSVHRPSLAWFQEMHSFLGDSVEERLGSTASGADSTPGEAEANNTKEENHETEETPVQDSAETSSQDPAIEQFSIEATIDRNLDPLQDEHSSEEILSDATPCTIILTPTTSDQHFILPNKRKVFRKSRPHSDNTVLNALQRLENTVTSVVSTSQQEQTQPPGQLEDEFHMFAMSVAAQLRQLPVHIAVATQSKIQSTLSEARLASIFSNSLASTSLSVKSEDLTHH